LLAIFSNAVSYNKDTSSIITVYNHVLHGTVEIMIFYILRLQGNE
jgi:hypothetical protein